MPAATLALRHVTDHGNGNGGIHQFGNSRRNAFAFIADDYRRAAFCIPLAIILSVHGGAKNPHTAIFQDFDGLRQVRDPRNRHIFDRPSADFGHGTGQTDCPMLWDNNAMHPARISRSQNRAEIVRIFQVIQQ